MSLLPYSLSRLFSLTAFTAIVSMATVAVGNIGVAQAYDITSKAPVNVTSARVALQSHDPVAYQTVGKPVLGVERFSAEHEGAVYRFSSEENLKAFKAAPAKYAPVHGGFCQQGAAGGRKLDGDPSIFRVADGKLALFSYKAARDSFLKDPAGNAKKANDNWTKIHDKTPRELFGL
ncbi:YHS domain-containing (seleno)protein [Rhizobium leguminosarum]|uniref:YHS domain-containing (seleno)protein n=1 Tax=Rhizobium leguminosarum TaxID=384 RepID=UPI0014413790|nr:YHS domain-containing (seleno)protein [Rhizobium leguminosarum]NKN02292.1 YHS domain-containing protein [Rhizobium leguminosarum bv. viciae]